jgi:hypothetical protein
MSAFLFLGACSAWQERRVSLAGFLMTLATKAQQTRQDKTVHRFAATKFEPENGIQNASLTGYSARTGQ